MIPLLLQFLSAVAFVSASFGHQAGAVLTTVHSFQAFTNGAYPVSAPIPGNDGYFYGTTSGGGTSGGVGTVFRISTNGAVTRLFSFTGGNDGAYPNQLLLGSDGYFYGTTASGGTNNSGTVFKISTNGILTSLHSFNGSDEGTYTQSGLALGSDGNLYGMTEFGGSNDYGTIFKVTTNEALTTLYSFTGGSDGAQPQGSLIQDSDGSFYGTAYMGGEGGSGTVFSLAIKSAFLSVELSANAATLSWSTEAGAKYQLQANSDLSSSNWTSLGNPRHLHRSHASAPGLHHKRRSTVLQIDSRAIRILRKCRFSWSLPNVLKTIRVSIFATDCGSEESVETLYYEWQWRRQKAKKLLLVFI